MSDDQRVPAVRRPRHLLDPNDLHRSHQRSQSSQESLTNVQRWVMSILAITTILHLSAGLAIAAVFMDDAKVDARVGLNVIAAIIGVLAVAAFRLIHQKSLLTPLAPARRGPRAGRPVLHVPLSRARAGIGSRVVQVPQKVW